MLLAKFFSAYRFDRHCVESCILMTFHANKTKVQASRKAPPSMKRKDSQTKTISSIYPLKQTTVVFSIGERKTASTKPDSKIPHSDGLSLNSNNDETGIP